MFSLRNGRKLCAKTETEKSINQTTMKVVFLLSTRKCHQVENKEDKIACQIWVTILKVGPSRTQYWGISDSVGRPKTQSWATYDKVGWPRTQSWANSYMFGRRLTQIWAISDRVGQPKTQSWATTDRVGRPRSKTFIDFDDDWGETIPNEGRYGLNQSATIIVCKE